MSGQENHSVPQNDSRKADWEAVSGKPTKWGVWDNVRARLLFVFNTELALHLQSSWGENRTEKDRFLH